MGTPRLKVSVPGVVPATEDLRVQRISVMMNRLAVPATEDPEVGSFSRLLAKMVGTFKGGMITHHVLDELGKWMPSHHTKQGLIDITISVCGQAYKELDLRVPRKEGASQAKINPDTGEQVCVISPGLVDLHIGDVAKW